MPDRVLVVDDEKLIRWSICERLRAEGFDCSEAESGASARTQILEHRFQLALVDLRLPDADGMQLLRFIDQKQPGLPAVIITAYSTVESAIHALKSGAKDYVTKPFNMDELMATVRSVLAATRVDRRDQSEALSQREKFGLANVIGESPAIREVKELVKRISTSETTTVLLLGESGTGKDMIARAIHYESARDSFPFMNITCTALPESLLSSELFGYEKGAFTDALTRKKGLFEIADGGSVFLDEIGDMPPTLQSKLLRVLEDKAFKRIGGTDDIRVDVRIIAATNRDLEKAMRDQLFREDLYYRLCTVPVYLPPLRERREDIARLAAHFFAQFREEFKRDIHEFAPDAMEKLMAYHWPGNVRELRNAIERAVLLCNSSAIGPDDIFLGRAALSTPAPGEFSAFRLPDKGCNMADVERELIRQALERTHWNQTRAARLIGYSRDQIRYKMDKFNLAPPAGNSDMN